MLRVRFLRKACRPRASRLIASRVVFRHRARARGTAVLTKRSAREVYNQPIRAHGKRFKRRVDSFKRRLAADRSHTPPLGFPVGASMKRALGARGGNSPGRLGHQGGASLAPLGP